MKRVAVLGCGPAGLLAAYAARQEGARVQIISRKVPSALSGAQYLHEPIPGVSPSEPMGELTYLKVGNKRGYASKVYGSASAPCSWTRYSTGVHPAWSLRDTYLTLWQIFERWIIDVEIDDEIIEACLRNFDLVLCTLPAQYLCYDESHSFPGSKVYITRRIPDGLKVPENTIIYNGRHQDPWYRASRIFGAESVERVRLAQGYDEGVKPIATDCDCWLGENLVRVGRFGQWKKGVLVHHAYKESLHAVHCL